MAVVGRERILGRGVPFSLVCFGHGGGCMLVVVLWNLFLPWSEAGDGVSTRCWHVFVVWPTLGLALGTRGYNI